MEQLAQIVLALLGIGVVIAIVQHGPAGFPKWLRAKFLGKT